MALSAGAQPKFQWMEEEKFMLRTFVHQHIWTEACRQTINHMLLSIYSVSFFRCLCLSLPLSLDPSLFHRIPCVPRSWNVYCRQLFKHCRYISKIAHTRSHAHISYIFIAHAHHTHTRGRAMVETDRQRVCVWKTKKRNVYKASA